MEVNKSTTLSPLFAKEFLFSIYRVIEQEHTKQTERQRLNDTFY